MTDLFLWLSDGTDQPSAQAWEKYSISYWHNKLWTGDPSYKFDSQINNSLVFASQGCALSIYLPPARQLTHAVGCGRHHDDPDGTARVHRHV